ncbi:hypothetical protein BH11ACT8_BH11ACT8_20690 [soil metagenome]
MLGDMSTLLRGAVAALLLTALTLTAGCSDIKDAATNKAGEAGCAVAKKAVDGVKSQVDDAIDQIGADPESARKKLSGARDALKKAEGSIGGGTKQKLTSAREALDDLVAEASDAASGADVDTSAIDTSKEKFSTAVDDVTGAC